MKALKAWEAWEAWVCHHRPDRTRRPEALFLARHRRGGEHIRWAAEPAVAEIGERPSPLSGTQLSAAVRISRAAGHRTAPAVRAGRARIRPSGDSPYEHTTPTRYTFRIYGRHRHGHCDQRAPRNRGQDRPECGGSTTRARLRLEGGHQTQTDGQCPAPTTGKHPSAPSPPPPGSGGRPQPQSSMPPYVPAAHRSRPVPGIDDGALGSEPDGPARMLNVRRVSPVLASVAMTPPARHPPDRPPRAHAEAPDTEQSPDPPDKSREVNRIIRCQRAATG